MYDSSFGTMMAGVQTGVRLEEKLGKVLKTLTEFLLSTGFRRELMREWGQIQGGDGSGKGRLVVRREAR